MSDSHDKQRQERCAWRRHALVGQNPVSEHVSVLDEGTTVLVIFAWRADPNRYAMRLDWNDDSCLILMEELDTDAVRGRNPAVAGRIELDVSTRRIETPKGDAVPYFNDAGQSERTVQRLTASALDFTGVVATAGAGALASWIEAAGNGAARVLAEAHQAATQEVLEALGFHLSPETGCWVLPSTALP